MKQLIQKFFNNIIQKTITTKNDFSSTRVQSYLLLLTILIGFIFFFIIEIIDFIVSMYFGKVYIISTEIIIIYGMMLSHHIGITLSRTKTKSIDEIKEEITDSSMIDESEDK